HNQKLVVVRKTPTLARVVELARGLERVDIVDEAFEREPSELKHLVAKYRHSFGEVLTRNVEFFYYRARSQIDHAEARLTIESGALKKSPFVINKSLSEGVGIMRPTVYYFISISRNLVGVVPSFIILDAIRGVLAL